MLDNSAEDKELLLSQKVSKIPTDELQWGDNQPTIREGRYPNNQPSNI